MPDPPANTPVAPPKSSPLLACLAVLLLSVLLARLSNLVQPQWSPFLLFPLACGGLLGAGLLLIHRRLWPSRRWLLALAVAGGVLSSSGQHYFAYRDYLRSHEQKRQKDPQVALFEQALGKIEPTSFGNFLQFSARERNVGPFQLHGAMVWFSWMLDALLTVGAAVAVVYFNTRGN